MLNTVIYARDKWLKPGGVLLPDKASMYIAGIEDGDYKNEKIDFWNNVYGFNMSCIKQIAYREPLVDTVEANAQVTTSCCFMKIDLNNVKVGDLAFTSKFSLKATHRDYLHGFIAWFDVEFSRCHKPIIIRTGPKNQYTHWKQTVFYLEDVLSIDEGEAIKGEIKCSPNLKNPRDLDISIHIDYDGKHASLHKTQEYLLR